MSEATLTTLELSEESASSRLRLTTEAPTSGATTLVPLSRLNTALLVRGLLLKGEVPDPRRKPEPINSS